MTVSPSLQFWPLGGRLQTAHGRAGRSAESWAAAGAVACGGSAAAPRMETLWELGNIQWIGSRAYRKRMVFPIKQSMGIWKHHFKLYVN